MNAMDSAYWSRQARLRRGRKEHADGHPRIPEAAIGLRVVRPETAVESTRPTLLTDDGGVGPDSRRAIAGRRPASRARFLTSFEKVFPPRGGDPWDSEALSPSRTP